MSWEEQRRINQEVDARLRELMRLIGKLPVRWGEGSRRDPFFWARIDARWQWSDAGVWAYDFTEMFRGPFYPWFVELPDGRKGDGFKRDRALNTIEVMNEYGSLKGNGIDHGDPDYPSTFSLQPVPTGVIVLMREDQTVNATLIGGQTYNFTYENAEYGACPPTE